MKRIALVTWLGTGNFGTSLQSYALHEFLKNKGYHITYLHQYDESNWTLIHRIRYVLHQWGAIVKKRIVGLRSPKIWKLYLFNRDNYSHTYILSRRQYEKLIASTDVFLTGSDQIWNCYNEYNPFMFLDFAGDVKRIAYASSMGTAAFPNQYKEEVKKSLCRYHRIGVREQSSVDYLNRLLCRNDVIQVLDPTFLLYPRDWVAFALKGNVKQRWLPKQYIFCYLIGSRNEYERQLQQLQNETGIKDVILIPSLENCDISFLGTTVYKDADPYDFVYLLSNSTLVVTDSFHACAISINLSKDFVVFKRFADGDKVSQNSRLEDLLNRYGLTERWYKADVTYKPTDYNDIQRKLEFDRRRSVDFLINSIETSKA